MKKYLAVLFSVIFLLSFTVAAFAIHEEMPPDEAVTAKGPSKITLGGKIIVRGWYFDNIDTSNSPGVTKSGALYTTNAYLTVDAKVSDNVRAYMELETSAKESNNSGVIYWGSYDTKNDMELKFRQLWLQYTGSGLLGVPAGIKAGHMPIALGEKIFLNNERFGDDAILVWVDPMKELHILAGTAKLVESSSTTVGAISHSQDLDGYVALMTYMLNKDTTIGANWTWAHSDANIPSLGLVTSSLNFHNVGFHGNGNIAGLSYAAEADFQFGQANNVNVSKLDIDDANLHFQGYALYAKAAYDLDMLKLRASFALGSGDNGQDQGSIKEFQAMQGSDFNGGIARYTHYTLLYERFLRTAAAEALLTTFPGGNVRTTGIANTTYYNIGVDLKPIKQLNVSLDGFLLEATKTGLWEQKLDGANVSKGLGSEVDAKLNYKIAKNISYFVEAGVFFPGNFYKDTAPLFSDASKKTATMAVHGLLLEF
jgi:hypothetical protein